MDEIVETLLDGGAAYFSDEEGNSMDDVLDTVDLPPFDDGPPVGATMEPQASGDARSDAWNRLRSLPPRRERGDR